MPLAERYTIIEGIIPCIIVKIANDIMILADIFLIILKNSACKFIGTIIFMIYNNNTGILCVFNFSLQ